MKRVNYYRRCSAVRTENSIQCRRVRNATHRLTTYERSVAGHSLRSPFAGAKTVEVSYARASSDLSLSSVTSSRHNMRVAAPSIGDGHKSHIDKTNNSGRSTFNSRELRKEQL
ncbi:hypothetical protein AVEN_35948-1 [Araneus ventricosus]|uniref:Uncharacterized protein n=1 Tax=Araneus ventricosus TaxID=182803 RepID=A0A4Y2GYT2_ARAVE|nr:hypothetical protein AVEN_35948-1 [Araneus ventricosus]